MLKRFTQSFLLATLLLMTQQNILTAQSRLKIAELIVAEGTVERKQLGEIDYRSIAVHSDLFHGDLLRVKKGGRAIIRCTANRTTWLIPDDNIPRGVANTCSPPS